MKNISTLCSFLFLLSIFISCGAPKIIKTEVLVIGGGTAGTAAAISSARLGAKTILLYENPWLGGMLTAAGVSAVDGNSKLPSGFWGEFRDSLVSHYKGEDRLKTGWVSNNMFEPAVGASILMGIAQKEAALSLYRGTWETIEETDQGWRISMEYNTTKIDVLATVVIDATELGDVAKEVGIPYHIGMDSQDRFNESIAPLKANNIIQDLTYVLILEEYDKPVTPIKPKGYLASEFYCATKNENCTKEMKRTLWPSEKMITYGLLPNKKYMINWPINGNDFYANGIDSNNEERQLLFEKAKLKSKQFLYYLQTELGFDRLGIAQSEFPTPDGLPFIPYHRESRRTEGIITLTINDISSPYKQPNPLYRTGIAVGDYPVDHHHDAHPEADDLPELYFYPIPSYSVPLGCLIPQNVDNFLVTEKSISVSNIVNGTTRLQPVVLQLGQAAGITAATAALNHLSPESINPRLIQKEFLNQGGYILPYLDVPKKHPYFFSYQRIGATGILRGTGKNVGWENQTWFYPDLVLKSGDIFLEEWRDVFPEPLPEKLTVVNVIQWLQKTIPSYKQPAWLENTTTVKNHFSFDAFTDSAPITRGQFAVLLDTLFNPFDRQIDLYGNFITKKYPS